MFQKSMLSVVMGASALAACLLSSGVSYAGATASSGFAFPYADQNCFAVGGGAVTNTCTTDKQWMVSDYIQVTGNHTVLVNGRRPSVSSTFACAACATTKEGTFANCTPTTTLNVVGVNTQLNIGTVNVPAFGSLYVSCTLGPNALFGSASF